MIVMLIECKLRCIYMYPVQVAAGGPRRVEMVLLLPLLNSAMPPAPELLAREKIIPSPQR